LSAEYWRQLDCAGRVPMAVSGFGKRKLWSYAELQSWAKENFPTRENWLKIKNGK